MTSLITALGLGLLIGAQHTFEPDHLAAIATMLPDESSTRRAAARGAWWGLGHGLSIAAIGLPLILLGLRVPEHLESTAEFIVALMLIGLGVHAFWRATRPRSEAARRSVMKTTLPVGLIHGLAGSGAAVVLATTQSDSPRTALVFLTVFVLGSIASMTLAAVLLAMPLERLAARPAIMPWLLRTSGVLSAAVGLVWGGPLLMSWIG